MGNSNKPKILHCCYHNKNPQHKYQCSNFKPYLSPCCIHQNSRGLHCNFKYIVYGNLIINSVWFLTLLCYIVQFITQSWLIYIFISGLLLLAFIKNNYHISRWELEIIIYIVIIIIILKLASKIILTIVPNFLFNFWIILLGVLIFFYLYIVQKEKSEVKNQLKNKKGTFQRAIIEQICCICMDKQSTIIVYPCLHMAYCQQCVLKVNKCALCRKNIHYSTVYEKNAQN